MSAHLDISSLVFKALDAVVFQAGVFCHGCMGFCYYSGFIRDILRVETRHGSSCAAAGSGEGEEEEDGAERRVSGGVTAYLLHGLCWFPRLPRRSNNKFSHDLISTTDILRRDSCVAQWSLFYFILRWRVHVRLNKPKKKKT